MVIDPNYDASFNSSGHTTIPSLKLLERVLLALRALVATTATAGAKMDRAAVAILGTGPRGIKIHFTAKEAWNLRFSHYFFPEKSVANCC